MEDIHTAATQQVSDSLPLQQKTKGISKNASSCIFAKLQYFTPSANK